MCNSVCWVKQCVLGKTDLFSSKRDGGDISVSGALSVTNAFPFTCYEYRRREWDELFSGISIS